MKILLVPLLLSGATVASANIADLSYQVGQGQFKYNVQFDYNKSELDVSENSTKLASVDKTEKIWVNNLEYGLTDKLAATLGLNYKFVADMEVQTSFGTSTSEFNGLMDPTIDFSYRLISDSMATIDVTGGMDLGFTDSENNAKRGGPVINFGADTSHKLKGIELYSSLNFKYLLDSTSKDTDGSKTESDSSLNIILDIMAQHKLTDKFYFNYGMELSYQGEVDDTYYDELGNKADTDTTEGNLTYDFNINGKYLIKENLLVTCAANYFIQPEYKSKELTTEYVYEDTKGYGVSLGFDYLF